MFMQVSALYFTIKCHYMWRLLHKCEELLYSISNTEVIIMGLNNDIGNRLREIRGKRTQEKFIEELDMLSGFSRSYYSMVEIGERSASLKLLDTISDKEHVSYDYMVGIVDSRVDIYDPRYHQLLEQWSNASDKQKNLILRYTNQVVKKGRM